MSGYFVLIVLLTSLLWSLKSVLCLLFCASCASGVSFDCFLLCLRLRFDDLHSYDFGWF